MGIQKQRLFLALKMAGYLCIIFLKQERTVMQTAREMQWITIIKMRR